MQIERIREVSARVRLSIPTLYRRIKAGQFPAPIKLGNGNARNTAIGFVSSEVDAWIAQQVAANRPTGSQSRAA